MSPSPAAFGRPEALTVLSQRQIEDIVNAALMVLETVGCRVDHEGARDMLARAGARVADRVVKLPRHIVQECLRLAPKGIVIHDRQGRPALDLRANHAYFGTATASPNTKDALTGAYHPTTIADIARGALVADALVNIDWVMPFGSAQDVPQDLAEAHEFLAVVSNTTKPLAFCGYSPQGVEMVFQMAAVVAGGEDALRERPFVIAYPEPITPLTYPQAVVERMFVAADLGQPQIPCGAQQPGATSPMSLAGTLAQGVAESLMSLCLVQLRRAGSPVFMACNIGGFNMHNGILSMVPPESSLGLAAQAQIARHLGLPTWGLAGATDAKLIDAQAGAEAALSLLAQGLAGLNLIHDVGYLDMGMACSCDMLVLGDELLGWVRRFMAGIKVDPAELALEVIANVGPGGNYLVQRHTVDRCRTDYWMPRMFTRDPMAAWVKKGSPDLRQRVHERVLEILDQHRPQPLPDAVVGQLEGMLARP